MDTKTKDFLKKIDYLIDKGIVKNTQEVIDVLDWNKSVMSAVRNNKLPVPLHIYNKFKEVYAAEFAASINETSNNSSDYKDKYMALLEQQLKEKEAIVTENKALIAKLRSYIDSTVAELQKSQSDLHALGLELQIQMKTNRSYGKAILSVLEVVLHHQQPRKSREKIRDDVDTMLAEAIAGAN